MGEFSKRAEAVINDWEGKIKDQEERLHRVITSEQLEVLSTVFHFTTFGPRHPSYYDEGLTSELNSQHYNGNKKYIKEMVMEILKYPHPEDHHNAWLKERQEQGYKYGPESDPYDKTDPKMIRYEDTSKDYQRYRRHIHEVILTVARKLTEVK
jgi:hypothetical protein